jgi:preprotein translocase subunit SecD
MIGVIVIVAGLILGFQTISIGDFQRGADTPLGLSLGLDLQGGGHLVYQANLTDSDTGESIEVSSEQMESLKRTIERRVNGAGLGEPIIQILGADRLLVQMPGVSDLERAKAYIGETAQLEFKRREILVPRDVTEITADDVAGVTIGYFPEPAEPVAESTDEQATSTEATPEPEPAEAESSKQVFALVEFTEDGAAKFQAIYQRLFATFVTFQNAQVTGGNAPPPSFLDVTLEGTDQLRLSDVFAFSIQQVATSTTYAIAIPSSSPTGELAALEDVLARVGESPSILFTEIQGAVEEDVGLTGDDLARAFPGQHTASGAPIVNLEFNDTGTRIFGELTQDIIAKEQTTGVRDQIAIFLDGVELVSPEVRSAITAGTAIIEGNFTIERVQDLALLLEGGRLPVPIVLIQERDVDSILGADSLAKSVVAGLVGLALVLTFMTLYYRLPGLAASVALLIYSALVLAIFKMLPVTLTLSGVAALILSIGMAVDANILIFERMKDELRAGRTLLMSINIGFDRAWPAIRDGNVSTLITCAILFWFADQLGASIVQGFAVTLAIGVGISMFTAITVSRTLLRFLATTRATRATRIWLPSGGSEIPQMASD